MKTMQRGVMLAAAAALTVLLAMPAAAQQKSRGIRGTIIGLTGKPLAGTNVSVVQTDGSAKETVQTDKKGKYEFKNLPVGTYDMTVVADNGTTVKAKSGLPASKDAEVVADVNLAVLAAAENGQAPPPGMTKEEAEAYAKKKKEAEDANAKLGQLNQLLQQNKQFSDAKQYDKAIAVMEQAVTIDKTHDVLFANLGEDYANAKQYDKAAAAYQQAITIKPTIANYYINMGTALAKAGKMDDANAAFDKASKLDPTQSKLAMYNLAVILMNNGDMKNAAAAFDKLLQTDPKNANAWYYKGMCLLNQATTDPKTNKMVPVPGTVEAFKKALELDPSGPNAATAKQLLQTLGAN
ncbi:MAG: tetratricopeptide repeat protein [Terriglobales bacterium]